LDRPGRVGKDELLGVPRLIMFVRLRLNQRCWMESEFLTTHGLDGEIWEISRQWSVGSCEGRLIQ
jgi:hypothetical protein